MKSAKYDPHIPFARLQAMMSALESDGQLDASLRAEMHDALDCLYMLQVARWTASRKKRRSPFELTVRIAHEVVKLHNAFINDAILAANPAVHGGNLETVASLYRKMKKRGLFDHQWISEERVEIAAMRLHKTKKTGE